jgi:two-component system, OmpR family, phosphate regulon sensor histidine kinase PhoR
MKRAKTIYLSYLIFALLLLVGMVWLMSNQPLVITMWIGLNIFVLSYFFPKVLKLPKIGIPLTTPFTKPIDQTNLLETIFSQLDQYVLLLNSEGKILEVTNLWYEAFDIKPNQSITMNELRKSSKLWSTINQALATEKGAQFRWEIGQRIFQSSLFPLFIEKVFYGLLVTAIDITKISQLENIQSDFLADISHEIKTPLAAILGASEILNQTTRKLTQEETKDFQSMIVSESSRLQRLIHELTDLSKIGNQGFQTLLKSKVSLSDMFDEVEAISQIQLKEKGLKFIHDIPKKLNVFVDRDKFFRIFSNLLSNAIRYTEKGTINVTLEIKKQNLILYFSDSGQGIEPQNLDRIFDRFYRTDAARTRVGGGTGLGLAITRAIVQAHQGTIEVTSKLGKGTTFTITIPHLT